VPILTLGEIDQPGVTVLQKWRSDLVASWKADWDASSQRYAPYGIVDGFKGTWPEVYAELSNRAALNHEEGEMPNELAQKWYNAWLENAQSTTLRIPGAILMGVIPGYNFRGTWVQAMLRARKQYLDEISSKKIQTMVTQADTLYLMAERAVAKFELNLYGALLRDYGSKLSQEEKEFLKYFFIDWRILKSDADKARAESILRRIGFAHPTPQAIQDEFYKVYLAAGGRKEDYMKIPSSVDLVLTKEKIISNGASNPITAVDWNQVQANQKVITDLKNTEYVSPLQTMFVSPEAATKAEAAVKTLTESTPTKTNPMLLLGLGFLALKLLRR